MAADAAWQAAKAAPEHTQGCHLALAAYQAAEALATGGDGLAVDWEVLLAKARLLRKLGFNPALWLDHLANACRCAARNDGGVLLPVYALHASRMRLLLGMPSARRWAAAPARGGHSSRRRQEAAEASVEERQLLRAVAAHCFLPTTSHQLNSPGEAARGALPQLSEAEVQADWRGLLEDCCTAMQWCLDKYKDFHRAAYRWVVLHAYEQCKQEVCASLLPRQVPRHTACARVQTAVQAGGGSAADGAAAQGGGGAGALFHTRQAALCSRHGAHPGMYRRGLAGQNTMCLPASQASAQVPVSGLPCQHIHLLLPPCTPTPHRTPRWMAAARSGGAPARRPSVRQRRRGRRRSGAQSPACLVRATRGASRLPG